VQVFFRKKQKSPNKKLVIFDLKEIFLMCVVNYETGHFKQVNKINQNYNCQNWQL